MSKSLNQVFLKCSLEKVTASWRTLSRVEMSFCVFFFLIPRCRREQAVKLLRKRRDHVRLTRSFSHTQQRVEEQRDEGDDSDDGGGNGGGGRLERGRRQARHKSSSVQRDADRRIKWISTDLATVRSFPEFGLEIWNFGNGTWGSLIGCVLPTVHLLAERMNRLPGESGWSEPVQRRRRRVFGPVGPAAAPRRTESGEPQPFRVAVLAAGETTAPATPSGGAGHRRGPRFVPHLGTCRCQAITQKNMTQK